MRKRARGTSEGLGAYQVAIDDLAVGIVVTSSDGVIQIANREICNLLGYSLDELLSYRFDQIFRKVPTGDQDSDPWVTLHNGRTSSSSQRQARHKDGHPVPVRIVFSLARNASDDGGDQMLVVAEELIELGAAAVLRVEEASRLELAGRLTTALERERSRIARELHDDIGQELAILRIQFLRAGQPVSGMPGKRHATVPELCDRLRDVAGKVSRLSHQLHSSELEYLGLAVAVQSHCREFSEKYKIAVDCSCTDIPDKLDQLLALALLRVVQEALYNVAKHSKATNVKVVLRGSGRELSLLVADDGQGFDQNQARLALGLGLISMRERIHLAGGVFNLSSKPGKGTQITATVPLDSNPTPG